MKRVTRDINPEDARDLLERVPRVCMAFAGEDGPQAQPIAFVWREGLYLAGISGKASSLPKPGDEVVFLIDEGLYFFDLRAIYVRGRVTPVTPPEFAPVGYTWFTVEPTKTVAWDYGKLRGVPDEY